MIKYLVYSTINNTYYSGGGWRTHPDIERARLYLREYDAKYKRDSLNWLGPRRYKKDFIVQRVRISLEIVND